MKKIKLTQGQCALVDDADFEMLSQYKWYANLMLPGYYAVTRIAKDGKQKKTTMNRLIMKTPKGMHTDHINGDTLDNRRSNLRICTNAENLINSYRHRSGELMGGVHKVVRRYKTKTSIRYEARRRIDGKRYHIGTYPTAELAHKAYIESLKARPR